MNPQSSAAPFGRGELAGAERQLLRDGRFANARVERVRIDGADWIFKDFSTRGFVVRQTVGRFLLGREARALRRLDGLPGVPAQAFRVDAFASRPKLAILGGMVVPASEGDRAVSLRMQAEARTIESADAILATMSGCNMAFRRGVFERVGLFDPAFGKGRRIGSAEDLDLMYRALRRECSILYLPHVVVRHAHGRDSATAIAEVHREYVRGRGAFYWKHITDREIARMAYWEIAGLIWRKRRGAGAWRTLRTLAGGAACQSLRGPRGAAPR